jgi:hypothetical protein
MAMLTGFLAVNAILHAAVIARYGVRGNNLPFLLGALAYAALALAVYLSVPYSLWGVLVFSVVGITGLTITFDKPVRDKTFDRLIWLLDAVTILLVGYLLFVA